MTENNVFKDPLGQVLELGDTVFIANGSHRDMRVAIITRFGSGDLVQVGNYGYVKQSWLLKINGMVDSLPEGAKEIIASFKEAAKPNTKAVVKKPRTVYQLVLYKDIRNRDATVPPRVFIIESGEKVDEQREALYAKRDVLAEEYGENAYVSHTSLYWCTWSRTNSRGEKVPPGLFFGSPSRGAGTIGVTILKEHGLYPYIGREVPLDLLTPLLRSEGGWRNA